MTDFPAPIRHVPAYSSRRFATTEGPAPAPQPAPEPEPAGGLTVTERAVDVVKNVLVIITCLAILYALYQASVAIDAMSDGLAELSRTFGS